MAMRDKREAAMLMMGLDAAAAAELLKALPPEKAQETFDVTLGELRRIQEGVEEQELSLALDGHRRQPALGRRDAPAGPQEYQLHPITS